MKAPVFLALSPIAAARGRGRPRLGEVLNASLDPPALCRDGSSGLINGAVRWAEI